MTIQSIATRTLRPTQMAVGMRLMKWKQQGLRKLDRKPQELVDFILENPIRVVRGPQDCTYVIDHHHLALALLREGFKTAPVAVVEDLSRHPQADFWVAMAQRQFVHPFDGEGHAHPVAELPDNLADLADDPYRSLAGFVRFKGGFIKTAMLYMEFQWADYFRPLIRRKQMAENFDKAVKRAAVLAHAAGAAGLPGYVPGPGAAAPRGPSGED